MPTPEPPEQLNPESSQEPHQVARANPEVQEPAERPDQPDLFGTSVEIHQGPLPRAQDFAAYDKIHPGSANRILKMAEREQKASIALRKRDWWSQFISMLLGKGFLYALLGAAVYLVVSASLLRRSLRGLVPLWRRSMLISETPTALAQRSSLEINPFVWVG